MVLAAGGFTRGCQMTVLVYIVWRSTWPGMPDVRYHEVREASEASPPPTTNDEVIEPVLSFACAPRHADEVSSLMFSALTVQSWPLAYLVCPKAANV
jgi:hypothetical protein